MPKADPVATATLASGGKAALASRLVAATRRASLATATGAVIDYQYDTLRRLTRSKVALNGSTVYTTAYAFRDLDASRTTTQVQYRNVRNANGKVLEGKKYTYDALGNITRISQSTKPFYTLVAYEYDAQNQLTKETYYDGEGTAAGNISRTISYTYDTAGNILSATETAGDKTTTKTYTYGDSEWLDLLTAINGSAIRYDAGGNPTNWSNGKADLSLQWANGRRLTGASSESARKSESLSYAYDADGVRTSKSYTVKTYNVIPDYVVTFVADGKTVKTMTVEQGYKLKDSDYPTVPAKTGYTGEWKKYTTAISTDVTVVAVYTKIAARHTVTFKADGVVLKTMTVKTGYTLNPIDYPAIPAKEGYIGSWPTKKGRVIRADTVISAIYKSTGGGGITVPTRPSVEIMSVDEVEPIEEENAVAPQGTHLASTQTITHEYLTQSGKVMRETIKTNQTVTAVLDFIYDESGKPFAMIDQLSAQPNTYYYVLNLQGDVVKLVTESGAVAASYEYDAWGNVLSQSGSMASTNPLRYRGYYYDSETGFYYLQSRYYDPATRRFINADALASTGQGFIGYNMFVYCNNRPTISVDSEGTDAVLIINEDAVGGNGHVCLLVQNGEDEWAYYSFAAGVSNYGIVLSFILSAFTHGDVPGHLYQNKLGSADGYDVSTLEGCKKFMQKDKKKNPYAYNAADEMDYAIYISGDFTKSYIFAQKLFDGQSSGEINILYNLISQNCMHLAMIILSESKEAFSEKQRNTLRTLRNEAVIPTNNIREMERLGVLMK